MELNWVLAIVVFLPGFMFALLGFNWLLGWHPRERTVARLTALCYCLATLGVLWIGGRMVTSGQNQITFTLNNWFATPHYNFPLTLMVDRLSLPLLALSVVLVGVVGIFSVRYLHRDPGYLRFFILLHLFGFGILLLFTAGGFDLLIFGWELVGITSVLLIAFFHYRAEPVRNALRVFAIYRLCDIGLLIGVFIIHHAVDSTSFNTLFPAAWPASSSLLTGSAATIVGFLLLFAAMGKAAQSPFSGWLPRAMEGPTPSSAIFYGALSVHAGAYLLLRAQPIISAAPLVSAAVILVGLLTAINGTMMCRISADAKTSLAYAAMTQLGIIFVEIGLGWRWFALLHITGHSVVRTLQFLRAPSMLHDFHRVHSAAGGHLEKKGAQYDLLLSFSAQRWLYRLALDHCHTDTILDRFAVGAIIRFAQILYKFETNWLNYAFRPNKNQPRSLADKVELIAVNQTREGIDVY